MLEINEVSFYLCNWLIVFGLVLMVYKIRHINDTTKIKSECAVVVAWLLVLAFANNVTFAYFKVQKCHDSSTYVWTGHAAITITYWSGIVRDLVTMLITLYF